MIGMPLHFGKLPVWLRNRMGDMGSVIIESVADNYGKSEVLHEVLMIDFKRNELLRNAIKMVCWVIILATNQRVKNE